MVQKTILPLADHQSIRYKVIAFFIYGPIAQRIEHRPSKPRVAGSNPAGLTK